MPTDFHSDPIDDVFGEPSHSIGYHPYAYEHTVINNKTGFAISSHSSRAEAEDAITHLTANQDEQKVAAMTERLPPVHTETCPKCRGSGRYSGYSSRGQHCFKCKGTGRLTFKNSAEQRARARAAGERRKAERAERDAQRAAADVEIWATDHPAEYAWLQENNGKFDFATSVCAALSRWGGLTEGQLAAVQRLVARDEAKKAERAQRRTDAPRLDVSRIEAAFAEARKRAARPGQVGVFTKPLHLAASDGTGLQFRPGSAGSQWEGMLFVRTEDGKKLGHVQNGVFSRKFDCTEAEQTAVIDAASDPERALTAYAKAYSRCGVCGRGLLNDVSIERGIGPICASRFGFFGS